MQSENKKAAKVCGLQSCPVDRILFSSAAGTLRASRAATSNIMQEAVFHGALLWLPVPAASSPAFTSLAGLALLQVFRRNEFGQNKHDIRPDDAGRKHDHHGDQHDESVLQSKLQRHFGN